MNDVTVVNVVRANAELLAEMDDPDQRERYGTIIDKTDRILEWSTKARTIERLIETEETVSRNVVAEINRQVDELEDEYPAVTFELDADDGIWIAAVSQVDRALWNVLENAAETELHHGTGLGLWLVYWVLEKSEGSLAIDGDDGTTVRMEFQPGSQALESKSRMTLASDGGEQ